MQADDGWFSRKCRKINHSTSTLSFLVPSFLNFSFSEDGKLLKRIIIVNFVICLMFCYSFLRRMFDSVLLIFFRSLASTESWWLQKYSLCMYWERNNPGIFFHVIYSGIQIDNTLSFQVWNIWIFFLFWYQVYDLGQDGKSLSKVAAIPLNNIVHSASLIAR